MFMHMAIVSLLGGWGHIAWLLAEYLIQLEATYAFLRDTWTQNK